MFSLQNAGTQLKALQKALKNPLGNAGLLAGEITKRAKRLCFTHTHTHTHTQTHTLHTLSPVWGTGSVKLLYLMVGDGDFPHKTQYMMQLFDLSVNTAGIRAETANLLAH